VLALGGDDQADRDDHGRPTIAPPCPTSHT
jgi:hypothetical protein